MRGLAIGAVLLAAAACGSRSPGGQADAAVDVIDAAPADVGPQEDASWAPVGVLTRVLGVRPSIPCAGCGNWFPARPVLRSRVVPAGIELRLGTVDSVSDGGVAAGFVDQITPAAVFAEFGEPYVGDVSIRRPFATVTPAHWPLKLIEGQPALPVHNLLIAGSLDPYDLPTSNDPAMGGSFTGCFTRADAEKIYIEILSQSFIQLIEASGNSLDVDCTGSGTLDGYTFEAHYEGIAVELQ